MSITEQFFSFQGRLRRSDYWLCTLTLYAALVAIAGAIAWWTGVDLANVSDPRAAGVQVVASLILAWPTLAVGAKRLHDRNQSGWWILLSLIPIVGALWMLLDLGVMRGDDGPNRYGPAPERAQMNLVETIRAR